MDRTPLKSLGNILPNCFTTSGQKKLTTAVSLSGLQLAKPELLGSVVKTTSTHGPVPSQGQENTNGKRSRHGSETERPSGSPSTPIKPSEQPGSKPGKRESKTERQICVNVLCTCPKGDLKYMEDFWREVWQMANHILQLKSPCVWQPVESGFTHKYYLDPTIKPGNLA